LVAGALALMSVCTVGWKESVIYPGYVLQMEKNAAQQGVRAAVNMPNLHGLLAMTNVPALIGKAMFALIAIGLIVLMAVVWKRTESVSNPLGFCLALLTTIITAYHSFAHDLCILLLLTAILLDYVVANQIKGWNAIALLAPAVVISCTPLNMYLWFRRGQFALIVVVLLFWFWAIAREAKRQPREQAVASL
jgi:hypothetical protein